MQNAPITTAILDKRRVNRVLGSYTQGQKGPALFCSGGLHGNEPAGILASWRVLDYLQKYKPPITGTFTAFAGNLHALQAQKRYIDKDLNRIWQDDHKLLRTDSKLIKRSLIKEEQEMVDFHNHLKKALKQSITQAVFLDLHTTSSKSGPFFILGDTIRNRNFARQIPVPLVLGLEEQIEGTLSSFLNNLGLVAINFEAGQHDDPISTDHHEAAIWLSLVTAGCIKKKDVPGYTGHYNLLKNASENASGVMEICFRYAIRTAENFQMQPGYFNFKKIRKSEFLAIHQGREIFSPMDGHIFMPLYQNQGQDGFFVVKPIKPVWLKISRALRLMKIDHYLTLLPGVNKRIDTPNVLIVNARTAAIFPLKFFHLLGFRKIKQENNLLYLTRRECT